MKKLSLLIPLMFNYFFLNAQMIQYTGKIINTDSAGIPNATIRILNTALETKSNDKGEFSLTLKAKNAYTFYISATEYSSSYHRVSKAENESASFFVLKPLSTQLDEVVVTAQKREENLQTVPISIKAITSKEVEDYRLWNSKELTGIVSNLYSSNPGDNRNLTSIRGITTTSYDPAVVTYIDGVNQFGLDTYFAQLLDIERIEVLRGPQGTLYGRNAMGGVINIITRQPNNQLNGFMEVNVGDYGSQRYSGAIRSPLTKDKLFIGAAGLYQSQNGFYTNLYNNIRFDKQHSIMGNYYLKYLHGSKWNFILNIKHNSNRNKGAFPLNSSSSEALENQFKLSQNATTTMVDNLFNSALSANYYGWF